MVTISSAASITATIYLIFVFAFASGAINALTEGTQAGQALFIVPSRSVQTMGESVLATLIFFLGTSGFYLIHRSAKPQTTKSQKMFFVAGFVIIGIALLSGFLMMEFKL